MSKDKIHYRECKQLLAGQEIVLETGPSGHGNDCIFLSLETYDYDSLGGDTGQGLVVSLSPDEIRSLIAMLESYFEPQPAYFSETKKEGGKE